MTTLRVATYNVHKCRGMDWKTRPQRILNVIQEIDADVIALQEIFAVQTQCLSECSAMIQAFGAARTLDGNEYGNAILSRMPIAATENQDLSVAGREPRRCLRVQLAPINSLILNVFSVHLGTSFFERRKQAAKLVSEEVLGRRQSGTRRIVAGDFNEWTRGLATHMLGHHLKSADIQRHLQRGRTFPGVFPILHLDHIYYDEDLRLTGMRLHRTAMSLVASDHLPLVADFDIS